MKEMDVMFCFFINGKQHKVCELGMITHDLEHP